MHLLSTELLQKKQEGPFLSNVHMLMNAQYFCITSSFWSWLVIPGICVVLLPTLRMPSTVLSFYIPRTEEKLKKQKACIMPNGKDPKVSKISYSHMLIYNR